MDEQRVTNEIYHPWIGTFFSGCVLKDKTNRKNRSLQDVSKIVQRTNPWQQNDRVIDVNFKLFLSIGKTIENHSSSTR